MIEKRSIKLPFCGQHPTFVLLRRLRLIIPEKLARLHIARFEGSVQDANENDIARHSRRRKHVRFCFLLKNRFTGGGIDHMIKARVRGSEKHLAVCDCRRSDYPAKLIVETPLLFAGSCVERIELGVSTTG